MRLFEGTVWDRPPRCDHCGELESECKCPPPEPERLPPEKQTARISVAKRKKGKLVTIVTGLSPSGNNLPALLGELKSACGAGGTLKDGTLELQGDHAERVRGLLTQRRYRIKE